MDLSTPVKALLAPETSGVLNASPLSGVSLHARIHASVVFEAWDGKLLRAADGKWHREAYAIQQYADYGASRLGELRRGARIESARNRQLRLESKLVSPEEQFGGLGRSL